MSGSTLALIATAAFSMATSGVFASPASDPFWEVAAERSLHVDSGNAVPAVWRVELPALRARLSGATLAPQASAEITLPLPDGGLARFRATETPLLGPELRKRVTDFRAYLAVGIGTTLQARLDLSALGVRALIFTSEGTVVIDPAEPGRTDLVRVSWLRDAEAAPADCDLITLAASAPPAGTTSFGGELRTLRYVLMATGEYTAASGGLSQATANLLTQINRINPILERDMAVRLQAVQVVAFPVAASDPYDPGDYFSAARRNTAVVDSMFGSGSYDLGQVFSAMTGPNPRGLSAAPISCNEDGYKAHCAVGSTSVGSIAEMLTMGHELGHAIGFAGHTQDRACNRFAETAFEVSSGITIVCSMPAACPIDFQPQRDPFYHVSSIERCVDHLATIPACGSTTASGNAPPAVDAGPDVTIPRDTPFVLTGSGSDADTGDTLTHTWEQFDASPTSGDSLLGPLFRWRPPTTSPVRFMPALATVLAAASDPWERLAKANRSLRFRLTVRDNHPGTGGVAWDEKVITVSGAPFAVTFPNGGNTFASGQFFSATWNVGGGIVAANVRLSLSTDGGAIWHLLRASTPNDGSESVAFLTASGSTQCRLKVEAVDNVFYDVSNANFTITPGVADAEPVETPAEFALRPARPNPASGAMALGFDLPRATGLDLAIFDVAGQRVRTLAAGVWSAGRHSIAWDGRDGAGHRASPGVYFARIEAGGRSASQRLLRLR